MKRSIIWFLGLGLAGFVGFLVLVPWLTPKPPTLDELPLPAPIPPSEKADPDPLLNALAYDLSRFNLWTSRDEVRALYAHACKAGDALACAAEKLADGPKRSRALFELFRGACDDDELRPCLASAQVLTSTPTLLSTPPEDLIAHLTKHCAGDALTACAELAGPWNRPPDFDLARRSCEGGVAVGCIYLTSAENISVEEIDRLLNTACKAGVLGACTSIEEARMMDTPASARIALEKYCARGDHLACHLASVLLDGVEGVEREPERALEGYRVACRAGVQSGCLGVARALLGLTGTNVRRDYQRAIGLLLPACDSGVLDACYELADAYALGEWYGGPRSDPETGVRILDGLCQRGHEMGCAGYAWMLGEGIGVPVDIERARSLIVPLLESRDREVLMNLAVRFQEGSGGVERNLDTARELYSKACKLRHTDACQAVEKL